VLAAIHPHGFLIDVFDDVFSRTPVWDELERRYGPRVEVSKEERAKIDAEIRAPIRSWIAGLGVHDKVCEEVRRRERRPLVERWLEEVLA
jgi:hypothetical protein